MAPSASSAFYARQIPPVEFHLSSRNSPTFQITLRRYANSIFKQSPWVLKFSEPLGLGSASRTIDGSRYSSSRASFVVSALRIMPMFIGLSLLLLLDFDLHGHRGTCSRVKPSRQLFLQRG